MRHILFSLFFIAGTLSLSFAQENIEHFRKAYSKARKDAALCQQQVALADKLKSPSALEMAYTGAFYAVLPEHLSSPLKKLNAFKKGKSYLEQAIKDDPGNMEIHFLRLTIQYNAPEILGYNENKKEDLHIVLEQYKKTSSPTLRANIKEFLLPTDLLTEKQRNLLD